MPQNRNAVPEARPIDFTGGGGVRLRGDAWGRPEDRPVVLLHGGGQTRHSWSGCGAELAAVGWYAIALYLRGLGESGWAPDAAYLPSDFVAPPVKKYFRANMPRGVWMYLSLMARLIVET